MNNLFETMLFVGTMLGLLSTLLSLIHAIRRERQMEKELQTVRLFAVEISDRVRRIERVTTDTWR